MKEATIREAIIVERAAINNLEKDVDAEMDYWRTLRRFNREEAGIIDQKLREHQERLEKEKWRA